MGRESGNSYLDSAAAAGSHVLREARRLIAELPPDELRGRIEARRLIAELPPDELRGRMMATALIYQSALENQALEPARVDRVEDDLLDLLEEAEAALDRDLTERDL